MSVCEAAPIGTHVVGPSRGIANYPDRLQLQVLAGAGGRPDQAKL